MKVNSKFSFPEEIVLDRYMTHNFDSKVRYEIEELKASKTKLDAEYHSYMNYSGSSMSLPDILSLSIKSMEGSEDNNAAVAALKAKLEQEQKRIKGLILKKKINSIF